MSSQGAALSILIKQNKNGHSRAYPVKELSFEIYFLKRQKGVLE